MITLFTERSWNSLLHAAALRKGRTTVSLSENGADPSVPREVYHRKCYQSYTCKRELDNLAAQLAEKTASSDVEHDHDDLSNCRYRYHDRTSSTVSKEVRENTHLYCDFRRCANRSRGEDLQWRRRWLWFPSKNYHWNLPVLQSVLCTQKSCLLQTSHCSSRCAHTARIHTNTLSRLSPYSRIFTLPCHQDFAASHAIKMLSLPPIECKIVLLGIFRCRLYMSDGKGKKTSFLINAIRPETHCVCFTKLLIITTSLQKWKKQSIGFPYGS